MVTGTGIGFARNGAGDNLAGLVLVTCRLNVLHHLSTKTVISNNIQ